MSDRWAFERLASRRAIVFADLVESGRLFDAERSPAAANIDRWHHFCDRVRQQIAPQRGGRVVRTAGDGLLLDFAATDGAVRAAFDMHTVLAAGNPLQPGDSTLCLRIGLHLDDVVADHNDLWGGGVNLAARLASLAQPGQTLASAAIRGELGDGVQADIQDLGERYVKSLTDPVRAFVLSPPGSPRARPLPSAEDLRPSVAVVPFVALPADPEHDALGHAMADDIIASLSRHPGLRVLSRASTAAVRGRALELKRLRELLGASFLLTGQFYVRGKRVRLNAELCELREGQVLWAGSVSGEVDAVFEGQDELVPHLVSQVGQQVLAHELARVRSLPMDSLASYSLLLGAGGLLHSLVPRDFDRSREVLEHLGERHPRQAAPDAALSEWHIVRVSQGASTNPHADLERAEQLAQRALEKNPDQVDALIAAGVAGSFRRHDYLAAGDLYRRALQREPQHVRALARLSESLSESGDHHEAFATVTQAIALSPMDPERPFFESAAARAAYMMGRWDVAADHARRSLRLNALHAPAHRHLIASLWQAGQQAAAREAASHYCRTLPGAGVGAPRARERGALMDSPFIRVLVEAGVPL